MSPAWGEQKQVRRRLSRSLGGTCRGRLRIPRKKERREGSEGEDPVLTGGAYITADPAHSAARASPPDSASGGVSAAPPTPSPHATVHPTFPVRGHPRRNTSAERRKMTPARNEIVQNRATCREFSVCPLVGDRHQHWRLSLDVQKGNITENIIVCVHKNELGQIGNSAFFSFPTPAFPPWISSPSSEHLCERQRDGGRRGISCFVTGGPGACACWGRRSAGRSVVVDGEDTAPSPRWGHTRQGVPGGRLPGPRTGRARLLT